MGKEEPISYVRAHPGDSLMTSLRTIDKMFINDQYWFLFPFHLVWDSMITVSVKENQDAGHGGISKIRRLYAG
jgi:hypothetical protein